MQFLALRISLTAVACALIATGTSATAPFCEPIMPDLGQETAPSVGWPATPGTDSVHPKQLLIRFKPGVTRAARQAVHETANAEKVRWDYHVVAGLQLVEVAEGKLAAALAAYKNHPDVLYAEPDYIVYPAAIPGDPDFDELWGMHNTGQTVNGDPGTPGADIQAVEAWDTWTGSPVFRIAVIDTGVDYDHPDLRANIWTNPGEIPGNALDDDGNGYVDDIHGYDFLNNDNDPKDDCGHGSHVAGTIGAVANNGLGVAGINWQCKIVALKFLSSG